MKPLVAAGGKMEGMKVKPISGLSKWGFVGLLTVFYFVASIRFNAQFREPLIVLSATVVVVSAWFFGIGGGTLISIGITMFNALVLHPADLGSESILPGNIAMGLALFTTAALTSGLKAFLEGRNKAEEDLKSRSRFLSILNEMTQSIITATEPATIMNNLADELCNLLEADHCYITRWDSGHHLAIAISSSSKAPRHFSQLKFEPDKVNMTMSVIRAGRILTAEDTKSSPYLDVEISRKMPEHSLLGIPLLVGEHRLGAALVAYNARHKFSNDEIQRAEQAGNQIAIALWNLRQELEIEKRLHEKDALARISTALSESERIGLSNVLQLIVESTKDLIPGAEQAVIHLFEKEGQVLTPGAVVGYENPTERSRKMRLGEGIAGQVIETGEAVSIADVTKDDRFLQMEELPKFRSLMVAPVSSGQQRLGTISVQSSSANAFNGDDANLLNALGVQAAIAMENANLFESTQQALKEANALYQINRGLVASLDSQGLLKDVVELLQKNFGYHHAQIYVADPESGDLVMSEGSGEIGRKLKEQGHRLKPGEGLVGYVAETGEAFLTNNVDETVNYVQTPFLPDTKSEMAVPVKSEGKTIGMLDIHQIPPKQLTQRDLQLVTAVADQLAIALQKANLHFELQTSLQMEKAIRNQLLQNERLAVMGRLLASVSHELNNPLQAIQNALFLLKEEKGFSPQGRQDFDIVLAESERMANMIERLRDTYRPIRAEDFKPTQINTLIDDLHALLMTHLRHKNINFIFTPDRSLPFVPTLADQMRQAILNLFMNAVEAMPDGGDLRVTTKSLQEKKEILLTVSDTGNGISSNILPNVFEAFITDKESGTGLGLTITYDIILKHNGRITAQNNPDCGAVFSVWLPTRNMEIE